MVDELLSAFTRQKLEIVCERKNTYILYDEARRTEAVSLVKEFRSKGRQTELTKKAEDKKIEAYIEIAKQNLCDSMLYLNQSKNIEIYNLLNGKKKVVTAKIK